MTVPRFAPPQRSLRPGSAVRPRIRVREPDGVRGAAVGETLEAWLYY
ncbi:hypothetical protein [Streptomyces rubiginosohelvolus]